MMSVPALVGVSIDQLAQIDFCHSGKSRRDKILVNNIGTNYRSLIETKYRNRQIFAPSLISRPYGTSRKELDVGYRYIIPTGLEAGELKASLKLASPLLGVCGG